MSGRAGLRGGALQSVALDQRPRDPRCDLAAGGHLLPDLWTLLSKCRASGTNRPVLPAPPGSMPSLFREHATDPAPELHSGTQAGDGTGVLGLAFKARNSRG
jgi:hypothetical protein